MCYFNGDINLLHFSNFITKLNKHVHFDTKNLTDWLNTNKMSLNVQKTELVTLKQKVIQVDREVKLKLKFQPETSFY